VSQVSEILFEWSPETSGRVAAIQIHSRIAGYPEWTEQAAAFDPTIGEFRFTANAPATDVEVRARFRNTDGLFGEWFSGHIITAPAVVEYDTITGLPTKLADLNPAEGGKLNGIQDGATVGAPEGTYVGDVEASALVAAQLNAAAMQLKAVASTETNRIRDRALYYPAPDGASLYTLNVRETTERKAADDVFTETFELLGAVSPDGSAFNLNDNLVMVSNGVSLSQRLSILDTKTGENSALIEEVARTITDVNTAIAQNYTTLNTKIGANESSINTLAETVTTANAAQATTNETLTAAVGGNSSSISDIRTVLATDSGSVAKALLRVNADGHVLGYSLTNDGTTGSFDIDADAFRITDPDTGDAYFFADDTGKVVMRNVEVDTIKADSIDSASLKQAAAAKSSFATTDANLSCPAQIATEIVSYQFVKEDADSVLKIQMYAQCYNQDDLQFYGDIYFDGSLVQRATINMIFDQKGSRSFATITPFAFLTGMAAGSHTISFKITSLETEGPTMVSPGATLEVTELRKASVGNSYGTAAPVTGGGGDSGGGGDGGGSGGGGGYYGGGGGYCVTIDTPILLADGSEKRAGELVVGDSLLTQHERTMEWGEYPVSRVEFVSAEVWTATIDGKTLRATPEHRVWHDGAWLTMEQLGKPDGRDVVAKITTLYAHTYMSNGILSHNIKQFEMVDQQ
jgi:hypothetical protein